MNPSLWITRTATPAAHYKACVTITTVLESISQRFYFFMLQIRVASQQGSHREKDTTSSGITRSFRFALPMLLIPLRPRVTVKQEILSSRTSRSESPFHLHQRPYGPDCSGMFLWLSFKDVVLSILN